MSENGSGGGRHRSPVYPADDLRTAVERLATFWDANGPNQVHVDVAIEGWGYSPTGSTGKRAVAALNHYGLLDESGTGSDRKVSISDLGMDIVLAEPGSEKQRKALEKAALEPSVYGKLWDEYGGRLPSRRAVHRFLIDLGFNHKVVDSVVDDYESTIEYADLAEPEGEGYTEGDEGGDVADTPDESEADKRASGTPDLPSTEPELRDRRGDPMPSVHTSEKEPMDLQFRLPDGSMATLRLPVPMHENHFEYLRKLLNANLDMQKEGLTLSASDSEAG